MVKSSNSNSSGPDILEFAMKRISSIVKKKNVVANKRPHLSNQALIRRTSEWIYRSCILCSIGNNFLED